MRPSKANCARSGGSRDRQYKLEKRIAAALGNDGADSGKLTELIFEVEAAARPLTTRRPSSQRCT
jgi:hypothetical protein